MLEVRGQSNESGRGEDAAIGEEQSSGALVSRWSAQSSRQSVPAHLLRVLSERWQEGQAKRSRASQSAVRLRVRRVVDGASFLPSGKERRVFFNPPAANAPRVNSSATNRKTRVAPV